MLETYIILGLRFSEDFLVKFFKSQAKRAQILIAISLLVGSGELGTVESPFHCYYSQVHSDRQWYYILGSYLGVK